MTLAIAALLAVLVASYRQVIAAFPNGGGSYAVARRHLGARAGLVAAASLILDYVLNVAVSVTAGVAALTSAFPGLYGDRLVLCLACWSLVTAVNLRGIVDSAKAVHRPDRRLRRLDPRDRRRRPVPVGARVHVHRRRARLRPRGQRDRRRRAAAAQGLRVRAVPR